MKCEKTEKAEMLTQKRESEQANECKSAKYIKNWFRAAAKSTRWWLNVNGSEASNFQQNSLRM